MDGKTGDTLHEGGERRGGLRRLSGIALSVIGILWLAHKAGWMPAGHEHAAIFTPLVMIAAGLFLVFGFRHRRSA